ncbi:MAG: NAD(P)/FAD-dependent oxidoreductase [Clostridiales bacterium]|nr:NAD(P)/FAD-dependent oxidoreductase [Clostridiales bacterium]
MNTVMRYLVLGGGPAAFNAAKSIREMDGAASITLVTDEGLPPYNRPLLTKALEQDLPEKRLLIKDAAWYQEQRIDLRLNTAVTGINTGAKQVSLPDGATLPYDRLIYALGARCSVPPIPGSDLPHVFTIRNLADVRALQARLPGCSHAVVIGGGVLGLEAAWSLHRAGLEVDVLEFMPRIMQRQLDEESSALLQRLVERFDVQVHLPASAAQITEHSVALADGRQLSADLVVISAGVKANIEIAQQAGIACDRGVLIDQYMRTSAPDVWACGDCAQLPGQVTGVWAQAVAMGTHAGRSAAGIQEPYEGKLTAMTLQAFETSLYALGDNGYDPGQTYTTVSPINEDTHLQRHYLVDHVLKGVIEIGDIKRLRYFTQAVQEGKTEDQVQRELQQ